MHSVEPHVTHTEQHPLARLGVEHTPQQARANSGNHCLALIHPCPDLKGLLEMRTMGEVRHHQHVVLVVMVEGCIAPFFSVIQSDHVPETRLLCKLLKARTGRWEEEKW